MPHFQNKYKYFKIGVPHCSIRTIAFCSFLSITFPYVAQTMHILTWCSFNEFIYGIKCFVWHSKYKSLAKDKIKLTIAINCSVYQLHYYCNDTVSILLSILCIWNYEYLRGPNRNINRDFNKESWYQSLRYGYTRSSIRLLNLTSVFVRVTIESTALCSD